MTEHPPAARRAVSPEATAAANRRWWEGNADDYQAEHGAFLDRGFVWGPEGLTEEDAGLLGDVRGVRALEAGCGAARCTQWLAARGAHAVGVDIAFRQLQHSRLADDPGAPPTPVAQADARFLPFADAVFDLVFSTYGALQFVADSATVMAECARVLRPGGRFVFSVTHPIRWSFLDDPGERGLVACHSYFDRTPYVEQDPDGTVTYAEHHRTIGDRVREATAAGLRLLDLVEPEWPAGDDRSWDAWSRTRGELIPGTAIFVCARVR
ncbi:MAG TPA: class I SAM-dependent methyltransferase [Streptosporangiaceae bacterium]